MSSKLQSEITPSPPLEESPVFCRQVISADRNMPLKAMAIRLPFFLLIKIGL
jgi:hypothetical protein